MTKKSVDRHFAICSLVVSVIGVAFYVGALLKRFAVLDDYRKLLEVNNGMRLFGIEQGTAGTLWVSGRVFPAVVSGVVWSIATDISRLSLLRILGLIAVIASIVLMTRLARRISAPRKTHVGTVVSSITGMGSLLFLPTVGATVTFATLAVPLIAIPTALLAGSLLSVPSPSVHRITGAMVLVFVSVFSYQQMAVLATLPVFLWSATRFVQGELRSLPLKQIGLVIGMLAAGLLSNLFFVSLVSPSALERVTSVSLSTKLANAITSYVPKSLHLFLDKDHRLFVVSLAMFVVLSVASITMWRPAWALLTAVLASYSVSAILFLGTDGEASYRLVLPGQFILWGGLLVTFLIAVSHRPAPGTNFWILIVMPLLILFGTTLTQAREITYDRISSANASDFANLECHMDRSYSSLIDHDEVLLRLRPVELSGDRGVHSEIGLLASHVGWVAIDMWDVLVSSEQRFASLTDKQIRAVEHDVEDSGSDAGNVIDLSVQCVSDQ